MTNRVTRKDHGAKAFLKEVSRPPGGVRVGVFGEKAAMAVAKSGKVTELLTLGQLATWLEYGTERMPGRFWLSSYVQENKQRILEMLKRGSKEVLDRRMTKEQVLNLIGLKVVGEIKERISRGLSPPNAESTIKKKGSSTPLIASGQFRASIAHAVDR